MKNVLACLALIGAHCAIAQSTIEYPYNPDSEPDGYIGVGDILDPLSIFGQAFTPGEILVDGQALSDVIFNLNSAIDSLAALSSGGVNCGSMLDMPLGTILPYASTDVPDGWMICDGREIPITDYQPLYDAIGTTYGAGDSAFWAQVFYPATTFNIPDLRGRTVVGADGMGQSGSAEILISSDSHLGAVGGEESHVLLMEELPDLSFYIPGGEYVSSVPSNPGTGVQSGAAASGITIPLGGSSQPFSQMQPYIALNYMMKVKASEDVVQALEAELDSVTSLVDDLQSLGVVGGFNCVEAGNLDVSGNVFSTSTESVEGYSYPLQGYRKFCVSGSGVQGVDRLYIRGNSYVSYNGSNTLFMADCSPIALEVDSLCFYVCKSYSNSNNNNSYQGVFLPQGVDQGNAFVTNSFSGGSSYIKSNFELLGRKDGVVRSLGIYFDCN